MTDEQLSELLAHPRVRAWVERVAAQAAEAAYAALTERAKRTMVPTATLAAAGDLNYADAAAFIGCPAGNIRTYVCTGVLDKGRFRATVTMESCARFKAGYKPRHKGRGARQNE